MAAVSYQRCKNASAKRLDTDGKGKGGSAGGDEKLIIVAL